MDEDEDDKMGIGEDDISDESDFCLMRFFGFYPFGNFFEGEN